MTVASDGTAFVGASASNNLYRIAPNGTITELVQRQDSMVIMVDLAVSADGTAYVAGSGSDNIMRVDTVGTVDTLLRSDQMPLGAPLSDPRSLVVDASGNIFSSWASPPSWRSTRRTGCTLATHPPTASSASSRSPPG